MTARGLLRALDGVPDDVMFPAGRIRELLDADDSLSVEIDLTLEEVGRQLKLSKEAVRSFCVKGLMPGAYKRANREWRIPLAAIKAYQEGEAERHRERELRSNGGLAVMGGKRGRG